MSQTTKNVFIEVFKILLIHDYPVCIIAYLLLLTLISVGPTVTSFNMQTFINSGHSSKSGYMWPVHMVLKHTHTHTHKAKFTAAVTQLLPPSDSTGMLGTTQTLEPCAANLRASNPQTNTKGTWLQPYTCSTISSHWRYFYHIVPYAKPGVWALKHPKVSQAATACMYIRTITCGRRTNPVSV